MTSAPEPANVTALSIDERILLHVFAALRRPKPLMLVLDAVHPLPAGWAKLRLFLPGSPWHRRNDELLAVAEGLAERDLLLRTRTRRLRLDSEYEITDAGRVVLKGALR